MSANLAEGGLIGVVLSLAFTFLLRYIDRRVAQDQELRGELYDAYHMRISELEATLAEMKIAADGREAVIDGLRNRAHEAELAKARGTTEGPREDDHPGDPARRPRKRDAAVPGI